MPKNGHIRIFDRSKNSFCHYFFRLRKRGMDACHDVVGLGKNLVREVQGAVFQYVALDARDYVKLATV